MLAQPVRTRIAAVADASRTSLLRFVFIFLLSFLSPL